MLSLSVKQVGIKFSRLPLGQVAIEVPSDLIRVVKHLTPSSDPDPDKWILNVSPNEELGPSDYVNLCVSSMEESWGWTAFKTTPAQDAAYLNSKDYLFRFKLGSLDHPCIYLTPILLRRWFVLLDFIAPL